jgi:hypothetical protein
VLSTVFLLGKLFYGRLLGSLQQVQLSGEPVRAALAGTLLKLLKFIPPKHSPVEPLIAEDAAKELAGRITNFFERERR